MRSHGCEKKTRKKDDHPSSCSRSPLPHFPAAESAPFVSPLGGLWHPLHQASWLFSGPEPAALPQIWCGRVLGIFLSMVYTLWGATRLTLWCWVSHVAFEDGIYLILWENYPTPKNASILGHFWKQQQTWRLTPEEHIVSWSLFFLFNRTAQARTTWLLLLDNFYLVIYPLNHF